MLSTVTLTVFVIVVLYLGRSAKSFYLTGAALLVFLLLLWLTTAPG